jgi:nucleotide-binding universal stress UspA family protein
MKLLIATDLSQTSHWVIDTVKARPWPAGTEVCILHVVDLTPFPLGAELMDAAQRAAEASVKTLGDDLAKSGLETRTEVFPGAPRSAVTEYAKNWNADFVVVGSHGGTGLARFLLGSVAQSVVRHAPCSVEIVRHNASRKSLPAEGLRVLVATDGSECSLRAVRSVAKRPWPAWTSIRLLSAIPPFMPLADAAAPYVYSGQAVLAAQAVEEAGRSRASEALERASQTLRDAGVTQFEASEPLIGDPKAVILDEAARWPADIVVAGSHGWRGLDRFMMGSVSESVAMHAHCSVEVIR